MSFLQTVIPGGFVNVRCRACTTVARFLVRDTTAISHWKRDHTCRPAPLAPAPTTEEVAA